MGKLKFALQAILQESNSLDGTTTRMKMEREAPASHYADETSALQVFSRRDRMNRFFNTAGPVKCEMHYCLPPLERFNLGLCLDLD